MNTKKIFKVSAVIVLTLVMVAFVFGFRHSKGPDEMMNKTDMDIIETAVSAGNFTTLAAALEAADLIEPLQGKGPFTVFFFFFKAFEKLPEGTLEELLMAENKDQLAAILKHHVAAEMLIFNGERLKTLNGDRLMISNMGRLTVNDAKIIVKNIPASNGVIHVIDTVLLPGEEEGKRTAMKIISAAIDLGVPLYNCGNQQACAAVYASALKDLTYLLKDIISSDSKRKIKDTLASVSDIDDIERKAWLLRHALDEISAELQDRKDTMTY